jgi:hypothetical protein
VVVVMVDYFFLVRKIYFAVSLVKKDRFKIRPHTQALNLTQGKV